MRDDMKAIMERLGDIEQRMDVTAIRVEKLENLFNDLRKSTDLAETELRNEIKELQKKLTEAGRNGSATRSESSAYAMTAVLGGLKTLGSKDEASSWLHDKLKSLHGPMPMETYIKGDVFTGMLFAKFTSSAERDAAVSLLRGSGLKQGDKEFWAKEDLPIEDRARKSFLLSLRYLLNEKGTPKNLMKVDSSYNTFTYRRSEAVKVTIVDGCLDIKWAEDWKNWTAFQDSMELRDLIQRVSAMLTRADAGTGHGKGNGASAAEDPLQRRDPWSSVAPKPAGRPHQ